MPIDGSFLASHHETRPGRNRLHPGLARAPQARALHPASVSPSPDRVPRCPRPTTRPSRSEVARLLELAVAALGGRSGPARSRWPRAWPTRSPAGQHLLVQAGTGTGKSLAYLVPALVHDERVVVATATLALQHQLVERDIPRLVEAVNDQPGLDTSYAVLKGRSNYACLHRIREGVPDDQGVLVEVPVGTMGTEVLALRTWAEEQAATGGSGERDHAPRHTDRIWRQVSVNHRECLGRGQVPVRLGVLRRAGPRAGHALAPDRHQPLAPRHRRHRGRADDPRLLVRRDRRGPRADGPGHPGGHRRARRGRRRAGRAARPALGRGHAGRRPRRRRRRAGGRHRRGDARSVRPRPRAALRCPRPGPRRGPRLPLGLPQGVRAPTPTPPAPRPAAWSRTSSSTPSGWPPTPSPTCCGSPRAASGCRRGCTSPRSRCGARCATSCSPTRPSSSPPPR